MFDWFWDFLYLITKSIFRLIDALLSCCNMLCGIEPVTIDGENEDLIVWLLNNESVKTGFKITAMVGLFLIVFFAIWAIIRTVVSEKPEGTPGQIAVKAGRTLLTFLFIPLVMYILVRSLNVIGEVLYNATTGGSTGSLGQFLALSFGMNAQKGTDVNIFELGIDYTSTSQMWTYFDLSNYDYFFSWVAGIAILFSMTKVLLIFIDRMFSIVILYIISPIPLSANMVDGGQRFKQWRDQLLSKFLVGYGAIIGLNVYGIVVSALVTSNITFFTDSFLNFVFKVVIVLGGTFALNRIIAMIGNIVAVQGAGEQEVNAGQAARHGVFGTAQFAAGLITGDKQGMAQGYASMRQAGMGQAGYPSASLYGGGPASQSSAATGSASSNKSPTAGKNINGTSGMNSNPYAKAGQVAANAISNNNGGNNKDTAVKEKSARDSVVGNAIMGNANRVNPEKNESNKKK